jgi:hypothetical protein
MDRDNLPGLTPLWIVGLASILSIFISIAIPAVFGKEFLASPNWIGFAGSVLTVCATVTSIYFAYRGLTRQMRINVAFREEDRIEKRRAGVTDIENFIESLVDHLKGRVDAERIIDVLNSTGLKCGDKKTLLSEIKTALPETEDRLRRELAHILFIIWQYASNLLEGNKAIQREKEIPEDDSMDEEMKAILIESRQHTRDSLSLLPNLLKEGIEKLQTFEKEVVMLRVELGRRLAIFRYEIESLLRNSERT